MYMNLANYWAPLPLAVVIGAGGIGATVARRLGQHYRILLVDIDQHRLDVQVDQSRNDGMQIESFQCDITRFESIARLADRVSALGGFSVLAHVTGLSPAMGDWRQVMAVNLIGPALVTQALFPHVKEGSSAVLVASLAAHLIKPDQATADVLAQPLQGGFMDKLECAVANEMTSQLSYSLSKYGVIQMARRLALTWGKRGARVMSVSPGLIASPQGLNEFKHSASKNQLLDSCPLGRQGGMQEIADAIEFLVSPKASYINGIDLLVDGGLQAAKSVISS